VGRRDELAEKVGELVAAARVRRIRDAWGDAAKRLGLEHRAAPRLFDDVIVGVIGGVPVRAAHLPLVELRRLNTVVEADSLGAVPPDVALDPAALLERYDRIREDEPPPSSRHGDAPRTVYRESAIVELDVETRAMVGGKSGDALGASVHAGKIVYQHGSPIEDGATLASLLGAVAALATALARGTPTPET